MTTVWRALNGNPHINPSTKAKIEKIADELGYIPNLSARSLVTNRSYTVGLFFSDIENGTSMNFLAETIRAFHKYLSRDYTASIISISDLKNYKVINKLRFEGICVISQSKNDDAFIQYVASLGIPLVVLNRKLEVPNISNFYYDEQLAAFQLGEYGYRLGHRNFALIDGIAGFESSTQRYKGFKAALAKHHIELDDNLVFAGKYDMKSGYQAMKKILMLPELPTYVFCGNDEMAMGAYKACAEFNVVVPDDISIVGFDNAEFSNFMSPGLTTNAKPLDKIGATGIQQLEKLMNGQSDEVVQHVIEPELIVRESVKHLKTAK